MKAVRAGGKEVTAVMTVNDCDVRFQLDSAADVNTISQCHVLKEQCKPTKLRLNMWNKTNMKPLGEADLTVIKPRTKVNSDSLLFRTSSHAYLGLTLYRN